MASATTPDTADAAGLASLPADAISYEDLYARWERGNWSATELDFTEDARQWREDFTEFERQAALWNYCLFFWGEDAVADNLSPYIDAAPREEQKYFLATQQVDEARHAVFFKRFMQEVCGIGDGSMASGLQAIKPQLTPGFRKIFDRLDAMADELRADRSPAKLAAAVTLYHIVIEASLAQPGQHFICSYLEERDQLPAFRAGHGEHRRRRAAPHRLRRQAAVRPEPRRPRRRARAPSPRILREVMRYTAQVLMPPGWDERYLTVFGYHLRRGRRRGPDVDDDQAALGRPARRDAARPAAAAARPLAARALTARSGAGAGGRHRRARGADARAMRETVALLFDTIRRQVNPKHGLARPTTFQWEFTDPDVPTWHLTVNNGSSTVAQGEAPTSPTCGCACPTRTGWTSSANASIRCARSPPAGCARAATRWRSARLGKVFPRG